MPIPSRELKITYGSTVLGGTGSTYFLDAPLRLAVTPDTATVEADVIVIGASENAFRTNCVALETAFRTPRAFLEVKFGSAVHETFDATIYTGMSHSPTITKVGGPDDTGRSRRYHVAVQVALPADLYANLDGSLTGARRASTINLYTTDSGRRRVTVTGTYTASATDNRKARAQYNAKITQYVTDITTAFTGTWEVIFDPQVVTDDQDTLCNFSIVLEELIFNQSTGLLDDPRLRRQHIQIARSADFAGDSIVFGTKPQRLERVSMDYSVAVDKAQTQDLKSLWENTIKPYLTTLVPTTTAASGAFLESEVPSYDFVENRISARLTFVCVPASNLLSARITTDEAWSTGISLIPVWGGDRMKKHVFQGPATLTRTVTAVTTEVGAPGTPSVLGTWEPETVTPDDQDTNAGLANAGGVPEASVAAGGGGRLRRIFLGAARSSTPRRIGPLAGGSTLDVVDHVYVSRYEYFVNAAED